jgi:hypothetical protein
MVDCTVELPQVIIILIILVIIFLYVYKKKENMNEEEIKKTSEMYIPNCNFLTDKNVCEQTKACYYYKGGCRYDWSKLQ